MHKLRARQVQLRDGAQLAARRAKMRREERPCIAIKVHPTGLRRHAIGRVVVVMPADAYQRLVEDAYSLRSASRSHNS